MRTWRIGAARLAPWAAAFMALFALLAPSAALARTTTALAATLSQPTARPGYGMTVTYRWDAEPVGRNIGVFVHVLDPQGRILFQDDHSPPGGTAQWSGRIEYERALVVPPDAPPGEYRLSVGLWDGQAGKRTPIRRARGVPGSRSNAVIARFRIDHDAPIPLLGRPTLDLSGYRLTFDEDFIGPLDVSAWGPGTRWIAHTPYAGDFGLAPFADPTKDFPFTVRDGILSITAKRINGEWRSGLLSSIDKNYKGFSQRYGYFETRAKMPKGPGVWPAFWLLTVPSPRGAPDPKPSLEIDVLEYYGRAPNAMQVVAHVRGPGKRHWASGRTFIVDGMTEDFHRYGALVEEDYIRFYFDGVELWRVPTPEAAQEPLFVLINLALGGGWPIDETPDPSVMEVDYVRVWAKEK